MKKLPDISQTLRWRQCQARTLRSSGNTESSWTSSVSISVYIFCVDTLPKVRRKESIYEEDCLYRFPSDHWGIYCVFKLLKLSK